MATTKKPTTRKPAKRGPTKAASLKSLGLTQADLDAIRELRDLREANAAAQTGAPAEAVEADLPPVEDHHPSLQAKTVAQQQEKQDTYDALVSAGLAVPQDLREEIEGKVTEQVFFARNLRNVEFRFRLGRQKDKMAPRPLKPRGERNDMMKLEKEDHNDPILLDNLALGCIEIITAAEAAKIIRNQSTNQQVGVHPAIEMLRTPTGKEYAEGAVQGVEDYVDESVVVAELNPVGGEYGELVVDRGGIQRQLTQAPGQAAEQGRTLGGNPHLLSDGFAAERARDEVARAKNIEGPAAGGVSRVTIATPKKVVSRKPKGA